MSSSGLCSRGCFTDLFTAPDRDYLRQAPTAEVDALVQTMLSGWPVVFIKICNVSLLNLACMVSHFTAELRRYQDRAHELNPMKAKLRKRYAK